MKLDRRHRSTGWFLGERLARINQGLDVHTIIDRFVGRHG
jgi:hypothetical protein